MVRYAIEHSCLKVATFISRSKRPTWVKTIHVKLVMHATGTYLALGPTDGPHSLALETLQTLVRRYTIAGLDWWTGLVDWTGGLVKIIPELVPRQICWCALIRIIAGIAGKCKESSWIRDRAGCRGRWKTSGSTSRRTRRQRLPRRSMHDLSSTYHRLVVSVHLDMYRYKSVQRL